MTVERRAWRPADLDGAFVCVASSDDPAERAAIAREARDRGVLVNVMDDIPNCDWAAPSIVRRGELVLAISTGGASPALAKKLRLQLSAAFGEEWAEVLAVLRDVRAATMPFLPDIGERASSVGRTRWTSTEAATLVREGRADELRERLVRRLAGGRPDRPRSRASSTWWGPAPATPGSSRCAAAEVLGRADVVVYDRLASPALLDLAPTAAERIYVGKEPGRAAMPQAEIDALLVERALDGRTVVRLKGGDPFVFGRGGEELLACIEAGVACEVVPGITSAIAAPAMAGIPVTHRGVAQSFAVVTGSTAHGDEVDLARVATSTDTLVVLMAAGKLAETCAELIRAGRPADEPAAIIQWAATPGATHDRRNPGRPADAGGGRTHRTTGHARRGVGGRPRLGNVSDGSASRRHRSSLRFPSPGLRSSGWNRRLHRPPLRSAFLRTRRTGGASSSGRSSCSSPCSRCTCCGRRC